MTVLAEQIKVMQAFENGKDIESMPDTFSDTVWEDDYDPKWNWNEYKYRVKLRTLYINITNKPGESAYTVHTSGEEANLSKFDEYTKTVKFIEAEDQC